MNIEFYGNFKHYSIMQTKITLEHLQSEAPTKLKPII